MPCWTVSIVVSSWVPNPPMFGFIVSCFLMLGSLSHVRFKWESVSCLCVTNVWIWQPIDFRHVPNNRLNDPCSAPTLPVLFNPRGFRITITIKTSRKPSTVIMAAPCELYQTGPKQTSWHCLKWSISCGIQPLQPSPGGVVHKNGDCRLTMGPRILACHYWAHSEMQRNCSIDWWERNVILQQKLANHPSIEHQP